MRQKILVAIAILAAGGFMWLLAQQKPGAWLPGGTPEENLWETLVLMGAGDQTPGRWNGTAQVSNGQMFALDGYRFDSADRILPQGGWEMQTKVETVLETSPIEGGGANAAKHRLLPKGVLIRGSGSGATRVAIETGQGTCSFLPIQMAFGAPEVCAGGRIEAMRIPPATDLSGTTARQHDFPSIAASGDGSLSVTWLSYHDRREELNFRRYQKGQWTRLIPVGRAVEDLWRPQVIADQSGAPWLIWSEQEKGNWDIYAMPWLDNDWGPRTKLSAEPAPDIEPHVARSADGVIYVVWQALAGRYSQIRMRYLKGGKWSPVIPVTSSHFDDWQPAVAAGGDGQVWIAWDRYTSNYDVYCRSYSPGSGLSPEIAVASTPLMEAYASVAVDARNRPWIAWESGGVNWGKDLGAALAKPPGTPLGGPREVHIAVYDNGSWKAPAPFSFHDALGAGANSTSDALLYFDPDGNLWVSFKRRYSRQAFRPSTYWETYLTRLDGGHWTDPIPLPNSWTRKSTRMGLAAANGRLWAFWPSESRDYAFASRPLANRVIAGSLTLPGKGAEPALSDFRPPAGIAAPPIPAGEARDVAAIRAHRVELGGQSLRIVRGDLHRHSELSQDVGGLDDGSLPEFYRYMIDAAAMDFGASTDHQGGGWDYWNFMTQKMADMYHFPQRFVPLYAYERNMGYPFGHRNILHIRRDYPIVPFFQRIDPRFMLPDTPDGELLTFNSNSFGSGVKNDTELLYEQLRRDGGLAIPHTSATIDMGTDWRDKSDPKLEPVVEIYQGARFNSEAKDVPRAYGSGNSFQEAGVVWNAWKKGYRLGTICSSDHYSTHISYAMVYTPAASRQAIFDSIGKRHTYGATDNIILEFWLGDHFMGDDFSASEPQKVRVRAIGTDAIAAVHLIRDAKYIYKVAPGKKDVSFEYADSTAGKGEHWYYVRVEQRNGELAWSSPIWVRYP